MVVIWVQWQARTEDNRRPPSCSSLFPSLQPLRSWHFLPDPPSGTWALALRHIIHFPGKCLIQKAICLIGLRAFSTLCWNMAAEQHRMQVMKPEGERKQKGASLCSLSGLSLGKEGALVFWPLWLMKLWILSNDYYTSPGLDKHFLSERFVSFDNGSICAAQSQMSKGWQFTCPISYWLLGVNSLLSVYVHWKCRNCLLSEQESHLECNWPVEAYWVAV